MHYCVLIQKKDQNDSIHPHYSPPPPKLHKNNKESVLYHHHHHNSQPTTLLLKSISLLRLPTYLQESVPNPRRNEKQLICARNYTMNTTTYAGGISDDIVTDRKTTEKRKRPESVSGNGKRIIKGGGGEDSGEKTVTDDEVDEFFAILRRIRVAVKYFETSRNGEGRVLRPALELPEFGGMKVKNGVEGKEENLGLDLNVDPVMDECAIGISKLARFLGGIFFMVVVKRVHLCKFDPRYMLPPISRIV